MILDNDNKVLTDNEQLAQIIHSVNIFIDCFTIDRDIAADDTYKGFWGAGQYSIDKVRDFYCAKERELL